VPVISARDRGRRTSADRARGVRLMIWPIDLAAWTGPGPRPRADRPIGGFAATTLTLRVV